MYDAMYLVFLAIVGSTVAVALIYIGGLLAAMIVATFGAISNIVTNRHRGHPLAS